jgi:hypothetical protein
MKKVRVQRLCKRLRLWIVMDRMVDMVIVVRYKKYIKED